MMYAVLKLDSDSISLSFMNPCLLYDSKIEILTIRQIHIPQPRSDGHNYTGAMTQIQYQHDQVNGQPNITDTSRFLKVDLSLGTTKSCLLK